MITKEQYKEAIKIVKQYEQEQSELLNAKNELCRLGRFPEKCCIILHTSFKTCENCGHKVDKTFQNNLKT